MVPRTELLLRLLNVCGMGIGWCLAMSGIFVNITTTTVAASAWRGAALSTLPVGVQMLCSALCVIPAGKLAERFGRRPVFVMAALISAAASCVMVAAAYKQEFGLLLLGAFFQGPAFAVANNFRFVSAEFMIGLHPEWRARAISITVGFAVFAAAIGPEGAKQTRNSLDQPYAGSYVLVTCLYVAQALITGLVSFEWLAKLQRQYGAPQPPLSPASPIAPAKGGADAGSVVHMDVDVSKAKLSAPVAGDAPVDKVLAQPPASAPAPPLAAEASAVEGTGGVHQVAVAANGVQAGEKQSTPGARGVAESDEKQQPTQQQGAGEEAHSSSSPSDSPTHAAPGGGGKQAPPVPAPAALPGGKKEAPPALALTLTSPLSEPVSAPATGKAQGVGGAGGPVGVGAGAMSGAAIRRRLLRADFFMPSVAGTVAFINMAALMVACPVAMNLDKHSYEQSTAVIQGHIVAMFLPGMLVGDLIALVRSAASIAPRALLHPLLLLPMRLPNPEPHAGAKGKGASPAGPPSAGQPAASFPPASPVTATAVFGGIIMLVSDIICLQGNGVNFYAGGLVLLGLGWALVYVSSSSLVTAIFVREPAVRLAVQSGMDTMVVAGAALSNSLSGPLTRAMGWQNFTFLNLAANAALTLWCFAFHIITARQWRASIQAA